MSTYATTTIVIIVLLIIILLTLFFVLFRRSEIKSALWRIEIFSPKKEINKNTQEQTEENASRLAGDSSTDAPPPDVKKKKRKGK